MAHQYTMQTGTWSAIGFPVSSADARGRFYEYANWCYQGGVFVSRSSGMVVRLSPLMLWSLPAVQVGKVVPLIAWHHQEGVVRG